MSFEYPNKEEYDKFEEDEKVEINEKLLDYLDDNFNDQKKILEEIEPSLKDFNWRDDLADAILLIMDVTGKEVDTAAEHDVIYFGNDDTSIDNIDRLLFLKLLYMKFMYDEDSWEMFT
jgi:hypothetical protein